MNIAPMAIRLLLISIFFATYPCIVVAQQNNGFVSIGASITATSDAQPWLSSSGEFAFGFQQVQGTDNLLLSIWYDKIPEKTIVWYPEGGPTVPRGSKVELINTRGLVLSDPQGGQVWTSQSVTDASFAVMNDTGNFVIFRNNSRRVWESFGYPADTLLPTQVIEGSRMINSRLSSSNFLGGRFQLLLRPDGNLVLRSRDITSNNDYDPYYVRNTSAGERVIFDAAGYLYISREDGQRVDLTPNGTLPLGKYYHRATLDFDGVFTQYYYPKNQTDNTRWEILWSIPEKLCAAVVMKPQDSRACGFNSVCNLEADRPECECVEGFSLLDPNDPTGDCKPNFTPSCGDQGSSDFIELTNVNWPQSDYMLVRSFTEEDCKSNCKDDCFCSVAIYNDVNNQCWKKQLPLVNGRKGNSENSKAFVKFRNGGETDIPSQIPTCKRSLIFVGPAVLATSVVIYAVLIGVICVGFFLIYKKTGRDHRPSSKVVETNLPHFTYQELVRATDGFKEELGKGSFGNVYKGIIGTTIVAVKKLHRVFQDGEKEFQTEVNTIAKTHHKNLVHLLGYCDDGDDRLLIYEYMSNGTLASFLFGDMKPSWKLRSCIAIGVAKGLTYLHEECSTQVIHCDIKPQNILLDDNFDAKISNFGLAKLLMLNQSRTDTGIRGTKGYVAPEWFRNTPVTVKVDVFSFGVLLLEIVSCRKSVVFDSGSDGVEVLSEWAWDCYREDRLDVFVGNDSEAMDDYKRLMRFVMVGLWCVQENPLLRPTMRTVVQMLEGVVNVTESPCPFPLSFTHG